jgi:hypothetical protein
MTTKTNLKEGKTKEVRRLVYSITILYDLRWMREGFRQCFGIVINQGTLPSTADLRVAGTMIWDGEKVIQAVRPPIMDSEQRVYWFNLISMADSVLQRGRILSSERKNSAHYLFTRP